MVQLIILFLSLSFTIVHSQSAQKIKGRPFIKNYLPKEYNGAPQNWRAVQDSNGIIYFANNSEIIQYDGVKWKNIKILDGRTAFTLHIDINNIIWCGTLNDVGFLSPDVKGELKFNSIIQSIPDSLKPIGKVRWINSIDSTVYISSHKILIKKTHDKIKIWQPQNSFYKQFIIDGKIYFNEINYGLQTIRNDSLVLTKDGEYFKGDPITSMVKFDQNRILLSTWKNGLFIKSDSSIQKFKTEISAEIEENPIMGIQQLDENFVLTGFTSGSYVIDMSGNLVWKLDQALGLENELCNNIFIDRSKSLWLSNNYGISRVEINSPFNFYGESEGINEKITYITKYSGDIFVATDDKLYYQDNKGNQSKFNEVQNIEQCYFLLPLRDELLVAAHYGVYEIKNRVKQKYINLNNKSCYTLFRSNIDSNKIYVGTEKGLSILLHENNRWIYKSDIEGIKGEIQSILELPDGVLWLGTLGQGIYKCKIKNDKAIPVLYDLEDGLYDLKNYKITLINNEPVFYSPYSPILRFDKSKDKFYPDTLLFNKHDRISFVREDQNKNLWMIQNAKDHTKITFGKLNQDLTYNFIEKIFNRLYDLNPDFIYPDTNDIAWFGSSSDLIKYDANNQFEIPKVFPALITRIRNNDSTIYNGTSNFKVDKSFAVLDYANNNIRFEFALPAYENKDALRFQYYLEGFENNWSSWKDETQKDYTNLFEGEYTFHVRGKDIYGSISEEDLFKFKIFPPWYRSAYAYVSYLLLFFFSIFMVDRIRTKQLNKKSQIELERKLKHQKEIEKAKSEERQNVRKKTAADFHDDLGHILTKISLFTELANKEVKETSAAQNYLSKIASNTVQLSSGVKDLIWTLDSDKDSFYDVLIRIKDFGDSLFEQSSTTFNTSGFSEKFKEFKLTMDVRKHLLLIFKEVMNNCLKYSKSTKAWFNAEINFKEIIISFEDNGIGFDTERTTSGNGLKNIRMRSDVINGNLIIHSERGKTEIKIIMKNYSNV